MVRPTLIDLNPTELIHYPFMISFNKCTGSCNVLSLKICVPKETKPLNVKVFGMITNINEAKTMTKHIPCQYSCTACNSNHKWNNETCQYNCKNYRTCKKDYSLNSSTCIWDNSKYLRSIANTSVIKYDEIITVVDIVSIKKTNTIATNVASTDSINCHSIKVRDCYILQTVLLVIILLLIIIIMRNKKTLMQKQNKNVKNDFKKVLIKNRTCYYFDGIIKLEDFDLERILIDEKAHENILIYDISSKTLFDSKPLRTRFDKIDGFIRIYDGTRYLTLFGTEKYDAIYDKINIL